MNIQVEADTTGYAPRDCRYSAVDSDTWDGAEDSRNRSTVGYGATPDAAVADLMALLADDLSIDTDWLREKGNRMSDILLPATLDSLRERERTLEFDACAVKARIEEVRELIALLEQGPRRRPGRPKRLAIMEMPQRVAGGEHQPETDTEETAA